MKNELKVAFKAPLNREDTAEQTYGCRANNPDTCANNSLKGICAFASPDCICRRPSKAWRKQYEKLSKEAQNETP